MPLRRPRRRCSARWSTAANRRGGRSTIRTRRRPRSCPSTAAGRLRSVRRPAARPTMTRSRCPPTSSAARYAPIVSSLVSGRRSQFTARYQARSTSGDPSPVRSQSSRMVREPSRPRLPSFQSPWTSVCGPAQEGGDQRPRILGQRSKPPRIDVDGGRRSAANPRPPRGARDPCEGSPPRAQPSRESGRRSDGQRERGPRDHEIPSRRREAPPCAR